MIRSEIRSMTSQRLESRIAHIEGVLSVHAPFPEPQIKKTKGIE